MRVIPLRQLALAALLLTVLATAAMSEDPRPPGGPPGETMPSWIFWWLLGLGSAIITALITAIKVLYNKTTSSTPKSVSDLIEELKTGNGAVKQALADIGDLRAEKQALRASFEAEKTEMRGLYSQEISALRQQLAKEVAERRAEFNELIREVMTTTQAVSEGLRENTKAIEKFLEAYEEAEEE